MVKYARDPVNAAKACKVLLCCKPGPCLRSEDLEQDLGALMLS